MPFIKGHILNKGKNNPNFGKKHSAETIDKMRKAKLSNPVRFWKGKKRSKKTIEKMRKSLKGRISPRKGIKLSKETIEKMKKSKLNKYVGDNHWSWKGGISKIDKLCRRLSEYKEWRKKVFRRDSYTCQKCGKNRCYVTAHHKKGFSSILKKYNIKNIKEARKCKELWELKNGITLCEDCHELTDNYKGRARKL